MADFDNRQPPADLFPTSDCWQLPSGITCEYSSPDDDSVESKVGLSIYINAKGAGFWIKTLPKLDKLRYLHLRGTINNKLLEAIGELKNLKRLDIQRISADNILPISKLSELTHLTLLGLRNENSIKSLLGLKKLSSLAIGIQHKAELFDPFVENQLINLELLILQSSSESNAAKINSLKSLRMLKKLKYLYLGNIKCADTSLKYCLDITSLNYLMLAYPKWWDQSSLAEVQSSSIVVDTIE